jgi:hypothetical protein
MKNIKITLGIFIFFIISILLLPVSISAQSDYVLPYPSAMPGNKIHQVNKVIEVFNQYWSFGTIAGFKNSLKYSDKYLVEAKILFEYKQYLLAQQALQKSDFYFEESRNFLSTAQNEGKAISEKEVILSNAAAKHREVLEDLYEIIPEKFTWTPEDDNATYLDLKKNIEESIKLRNE